MPRTESARAARQHLGNNSGITWFREHKMTMTVKLPVLLENSLRQRSAALGRPASELIREALQAYLAETRAPDASAYGLGKDLFGAHLGPADLSKRRKQMVADIWADKHHGRTVKR